MASFVSRGRCGGVESFPAAGEIAVVCPCTRFRIRTIHKRSVDSRSFKSGQPRGWPGGETLRRKNRRGQVRTRRPLERRGARNAITEDCRADLGTVEAGGWRSAACRHPRPGRGRRPCPSFSRILAAPAPGCVVIGLSSAVIALRSVQRRVMRVYSQAMMSDDGQLCRRAR